MTTILQKPLARELLVDGVPFKVIVAPDGMRITRKGKRKGALIGWETIMRLGEVEHHAPPSPAGAAADVPDSVVTEVAVDLLAAKGALAWAGERLTAARNLPPELRRRLDPDPVYGAQEQREDWYIEPLLTPAELASVLRLSAAAVKRLSIPWIELAGERRYRQSEVRRFLGGQERSEANGRWL